MSARHERAAADRYLADLQRALSCMTTTVLVPLIQRGTNDRQVAPAENPFPLRSVPRLTLLVSHGFIIHHDPNSGVATAMPTSYRYQLAERDGPEILAYHWHPDARSPIATPHLHVANAHPTLDLGKAHLPTGIVTLQAVIRCLITEFNVEPIRSDWDQILRDP